MTCASAERPIPAGCKPGASPERSPRLIFATALAFPKKRSQKRLNLRPGRPYEFFRVREGADKLERALAKDGFLEANVRVRRAQAPEEASPNVDLVVDGSLGPRVEIAFEGADVPSGVRQDVQGIWTAGGFDLQRTQEATAFLRRYFVGEGYVESKVDTRISEGDEKLKQVVFVLEPGPRYRNVSVRFQGIVIFSEEDLLSRLRRAKLETALHAEPQQAIAFLTETYRQAGYLDVIVERPVYEFDGSSKARWR
jgi:outer membrane protein assembly factor BamA